MSGPWLVSYVVLWALVLFQGAVIFLLLRQLGVIYLGTAQGVSRDGIALGRRAPDFALPDLDGRTVSPAALLGTPLLLVFGSASCAPCRALIPDLNAFAREQGERLRAAFLCRGSADEARRFATELDVRVPVVAHPDKQLADAYQARVTPFAFLIDAQGVVRAKGLANNRAHLDFLLEQAAKGYEKPGRQNGHNGAGHEHAKSREESA